MALLDIKYSELEQVSFSLRLRLGQGDILIVRAVPEIRRFREEVIEYTVRNCRTLIERETVIDLFDKKIIPSSEVFHALTLAMKRSREDRYLSSLLSGLIQRIGFEHPISLCTGISRAVCPTSIIEQLRRRTDLFEDEDFQRKRSDGPVEIFMQNESNIHRDFNRPHFVFMANFWIPLHDVNEEESINIFPKVYREEVLDLDNNEKNKAKLGPPCIEKLSFGDVIIFHSENMHVSPVQKDETIRFSIDLRVASQCLDDNSHYRDNFWNLNNFISEKEISYFLSHNYEVPQNVIAHFQKYGKTTNAQFYILLAEKASKNVNYIKNIEEVVDQYPFAEDRYIRLSEYVTNINCRYATTLIKKTLNKTNSYFWSLKCARLAKEFGDKKLKEDACEKTMHLSKSTSVSCDFNPVSYTNHRTQLSPDEALENCKEIMMIQDNQTI